LAQVVQGHLHLVLMVFQVLILYLALLQLLVVAMEVGEVVHQLLEVVVVVLALVLVLLKLEAQGLQDKVLLEAILEQPTMLVAVVAQGQLVKTSILLAVEMVAQAFVQP
jgi:hypothetical protein